MKKSEGRPPEGLFFFWVRGAAAAAAPAPSTLLSPAGREEGGAGRVARQRAAVCLCAICFLGVLSANTVCASPGTQGSVSFGRAGGAACAAAPIRGVWAARARPGLNDPSGPPAGPRAARAPVAFWLGVELVPRGVWRRAVCAVCVVWASNLPPRAALVSSRRRRLLPCALAGIPPLPCVRPPIPRVRPTARASRRRPAGASGGRSSPP